VRQVRQEVLKYSESKIGQQSGNWDAKMEYGMQRWNTWDYIPQGAKGA